ncbi:MAG: HIT family protein [Candidatus Hodarchaeales archaeon]|jgi:histidine triad (HIT) family protein
MDENCIFCNIIKRNVEAAFLYEDDEIIAFLDIQPINKGHALIIPKLHADKIEDIPEEIYLKMHSVGKDILKKIKTNIPETTAFNVFIANGADAGQDVFHSHLHIIPRKPNDGLIIKYDFGDPLSIEDRNEIAKEILK